MIQNERQYNVTKRQLARMEDALEFASKDKDAMDARVYDAMVAGFQSRIDDLR